MYFFCNTTFWSRADARDGEIEGCDRAALKETVVCHCVASIKKQARLFKTCLLQGLNLLESQMRKCFEKKKPKKHHHEKIFATQ